MVTISVPLPPELEERLDSLVRGGVAETRAGVMRRALEDLAEKEAIDAVLRAEREPTVRGDLRKILKKLD